MKTPVLIGVVVVVFAVSLPGMYLLNHSKSLKWDLWDTTDAAPSGDQEDKDNPEVDVFCLKGVMFSNDGQHDKAINAYSQAIKLDPKYPYAYLGRGDAYLVKGDVTSALQDYDRAVKLDPDNDAAKERMKAVRALQSEK